MKELLENDPWFRAISTFQFFACIAAWIFLIGRWRRYGVFLQYEPRRPVPWGIAGALLVVAFTVAILLSTAAPVDVPQVRAEPSTQDRILSLAASIVMQSLGPILLLFIAAMSNANISDLGLPTRSAFAWSRDVAIGVIACVAAILPVGLALKAANWLLGLPDQLTKHQLVEMIVSSGPEMLVLTLATVTAVVIAPIAEEIMFRLMLQGWLEKWEDSRLGWRNVAVAESPLAETTATAEGVMEGVEPLPKIVDEVPAEQAPMATQPPRIGVGGLPYGWTPIILSSLLFAAAHFGYGPEPVPLFVLALFLGYCYQRTHRIIPSIVVHGLFNLFSMITLWRLVFLNAD